MPGRSCRSRTARTSPGRRAAAPGAGSRGTWPPWRRVPRRPSGAAAIGHGGIGRSLELDHVALGVEQVLRRPLAFGAIARTEVADADPMGLQMGKDLV